MCVCIGKASGTMTESGLMMIEQLEAMTSSRSQHLSLLWDHLPPDLKLLVKHFGGDDYVRGEGDR
ncbi:hypothetical protein SESBI_36003 [Sesbania bispinosa]|nr:hypothetical protein SESBI_36003 [Sesbania bispinosa]